MRRYERLDRRHQRPVGFVVEPECVFHQVAPSEAREALGDSNEVRSIAVVGPARAKTEVDRWLRDVATQVSQEVSTQTVARQRRAHVAQTLLFTDVGQNCP